jgi:hypothetical protein
MTRQLTFPTISHVNSIVTNTTDGTQPEHVSIEVLTLLGLGVLEMSLDAAFELAAKLSAHLQADGSQ